MDVSLSELLELVMDREAWRAVNHRVTKSWTRLSDWTELKMCPTLCKSMDCSVPGLPVLHCLPEFAHIHVDWVRCSYLIISSSVAPFSSFPQSFPASGSFPMNCSFHQVAKYCSFSFSISPSNEYSGLISFRIDSFDFLAVQGTLKSLLQHHSSKTSILRHSSFFMIQLS